MNARKSCSPSERLRVLVQRVEVERRAGYQSDAPRLERGALAGGARRGSGTSATARRSARGSRRARCSAPDDRDVERKQRVQRRRRALGRRAAVHLDGDDVRKRVHAGVRAARDRELAHVPYRLVERLLQLALHRAQRRAARAQPRKAVPSYSIVSFRRTSGAPDSVCMVCLML